MRLRIVVDQTLNGPVGTIRKRTFEAIHRLKNLGVPVGEDYIIVGDPFVSGYVLRFTDDQTGEPDTLHVSEEVKRDFYLDRESLEIAAVWLW